VYPVVGVGYILASCLNSPDHFKERTDILALVDHDPHRVLARTRSGTLRLSQDARGLAFDLDVPDTQAGQDVLALAERNDLGGMSFGFSALDEHLDGNQRELRAVDLFEISVVSAFPAYEGTVINARAKAGSFRFRDAAVRRLRVLELVK
jgi:Escherichia/Staphylococcus phage prohead protease